MNIKNIFQLVICIALPLVVGAISGIATASGVRGWYESIQKPFFNPPDVVFGPVWTVLYILMGISLYLVWIQPFSADRSTALKAFLIQLLLNFAWSFVFFYFHLIGWAFVEIVVLLVAIIFMIKSYKVVHPTAAYLQIPYLVWVGFATILNGAIWYLN